MWSSAMSQTPSREMPMLHRQQDVDLFHRLKEECLEKGSLYEDPEFPADNGSIYKSVPYVTKSYPVWKRPKEIVDNPQFVVAGADRMDLHQGDLGNCWFVAAASLLTGVPEVLEHVMPAGQDFRDGRYAGIFRFRFWLYGEWKDVLIDDRLPVYQSTGELIFGCNCNQKNEFWFSLMEKAYAKLYGSYEGLRGGKLIDGLVDMTAGAGRIMRLQNKSTTKGLYRNMFKLQKVNTLMGCSIYPRGSMLVQKLDNGLYAGHAYGITKLCKVECAGSMVKLVRLRNPWGKNEWTGTFCDSSEAWTGISTTDMDKLEIRKREDGEFWMEFEEWKSIFSELQICYMTPESPLHSQDKLEWRVIGISHGAWIKGKNAGGSMGDRFQTNPKYNVTVGAQSSGNAADEDSVEVLVSVMQKHRPITAPGSARYASWNTAKYIAYALFAGSDKSLMNIPVLSRYRESCCTHSLTPGSYLVVPYTRSANEEAEYLIRFLEI